MSSKKSSAKATPALRALTAAAVTFTVHEYELDRASSSYGLEAAAALGIAADRVFKTLIAQVDDYLIVAVVPVTQSLDLKALAQATGAKRAVMADPEAAQRSTGYVLGGISPFGQRTPLATVIDASAELFTTINVSAGRRGLEVELAPGDLIALCEATVADISR